LARGLQTAKRSKAEFRRGLSALKKAGIVDVDIRRAEPYWVRKSGPRGGTYTLSELISKYDDIVSGKATPVTLPEVEAKKFKKLGYEEIRGGKIIVPHAATEKVVVRKGQIVHEDISGIRRVQIPCEYHDLEQYLNCLKKNKKFMRKTEGRYFAFRFYGNHSFTYSSMGELLSDLSRYEAVMSTINRDSSRDMNEVYRNLEIIETTKVAWEKSKTATRARAKKARKAKTKKGQRRKILEKLEQGPQWKLDQYRRKRAEQARQYRLRLSGAKKAEYKKAAVKRARKSNKKLRP